MSKELSQDQITLIKNNFCKGASENEANLFIEQVKRTGLDPTARQVYLQKRSIKNKDGSYTDKYNIEVSIDGFRVIAQRSGQYAGQVGPMWHDGKTWLDVWLKPEPPKAAKVGVLRHDFKETLWGVATWASYVQKNNQGKVGHMWEKMPDLMLAKVAEALALRKAFPNDIGGLYTPEEMAQMDNVTTQSQTATKPPESKPIKNYATGETRSASSQPELDNDSGNYVVQCGKKYKGMTLSQVGVKQVEDYYCYLRDAEEKANKPLEGQFKEFVIHATNYLNCHSHPESENEIDTFSDEIPL